MLGSEGLFPAIRRKPRKVQRHCLLPLRVEAAREFASRAKRVVMIRAQSARTDFESLAVILFGLAMLPLDFEDIGEVHAADMPLGMLKAIGRMKPILNFPEFLFRLDISAQGEDRLRFQTTEAQVGELVFENVRTRAG